MTQFDPHTYGPVFAPLVAVDRRRPLDAGRQNSAAREALDQLTSKKAFAHALRSVTDRGMGDCCLAAVWLLHDFLDESHTISQSINTATGSYWHAIMHRREGDFSNAKYWFRRVGAHEVFGELARRATTIPANRDNQSVVDRLTTSGDWDPFAFVDLCESVVHERADARDFCLDVQQVEWELLFDFCYDAVVRR